MADAPEDLKAGVDGGDGIFVIRGGGNCRQWNGIQYKKGLSAKNVGAKKLSMNVATIPPSRSSPLSPDPIQPNGNISFPMTGLATLERNLTTPFPQHLACQK